MALFPDSQLPTDPQKQKLCEMLYMALSEIRIVGREGRAQQAAD